MPLNVTLRVTLDAGTITHRPRIDEACAGLDVELDYTTVTDRETEGWPSATTGSQVRESAVLAEWRSGVAAAGSEESGPMLEQVLQIFSSGGFPPLGSPLREALSEGNHHHLLDAMIRRRTYVKAATCSSPRTQRSSSRATGARSFSSSAARRS